MHISTYLDKMNRIVCMNRSFIDVLKHNVSRNSALLFAPKYAAPNVYFARGTHNRKNARSTMNYMIALGVMTVGLSYAAVPLYRIFCQVMD